MSGRASRNKGQRGERLAVDLLNKLHFDNARRGLSQTTGAIEPDVVADQLSHFWCEVKFQQGCSKAYEFLSQAEQDAEGTGKLPFVLYKNNGGKFLFIADAEMTLPIITHHL